MHIRYIWLKLQKSNSFSFSIGHGTFSRGLGLGQLYMINSYTIIVCYVNPMRPWELKLLWATIYDKEKDVEAYLENIQLCFLW